MLKQRIGHWFLLGSALGTAAFAFGAGSCGGSNTDATTSSGTGSGGEGGGLILGGIKNDLPEDPIVEQGLPTNIAELFQKTQGGGSGGPCLSEPTLDAMVPKNWTPLFFEWAPAGKQNVFELRLSIKNQKNPLVLYTTKSSLSLDATLWKAIQQHSAGQDIELSLRGAVLEGNKLVTGPLVGAKGVVHLAPVEAPGSVVYWSATANSSAFKGFNVGNPSSVSVLDPQSAGVNQTGKPTGCVSCHTSSPDGKFVVYSSDVLNSNGEIEERIIDIRRSDGSGKPDEATVSKSALALLGRHKQTAPTMSKAHYSATDSVLVSVFQDPTLTNNKPELIWTDLHAADTNGWGILTRSGDTRQVSSPAFRRDGTAIAYVSSAEAAEGVEARPLPEDSTVDIYTVPYNDRQGGEAKPLPGASDPNYHEYYPIYSPGDTWLAFNRTDTTPESSYDQPAAEVMLVPGNGGTPTRLRGNDPPACTGFTSPGLTNSWPRWAPTVAESGGKKYYWLVFSSKRRPASVESTGNRRPQLYIAAIVTTIKDGVETLEKDYPALYVTAQDPNKNNHIPAWDFFEVNQGAK